MQLPQATAAKSAFAVAADVAPQGDVTPKKSGDPFLRLGAGCCLWGGSFALRLPPRRFFAASRQRLKDMGLLSEVELKSPKSEPFNHWRIGLKGFSHSAT